MGAKIGKYNFNVKFLFTQSTYVQAEECCIPYFFLAYFILAQVFKITGEYENI